MLINDNQVIINKTRSSSEQCTFNTTPYTTHVHAGFYSNNNEPVLFT